VFGLTQAAHGASLHGRLFFVNGVNQPDARVMIGPSFKPFCCPGETIAFPSDNGRDQSGQNARDSSRMRQHAAHGDLFLV
jgi:hypothetical protein